MKRSTLVFVIVVLLLVTGCTTLLVAGQTAGADDPGLTPEHVTFDSQGLVESVRAEMRPAAPYQDGPAFGGAAPAHLRVALGDGELAAHFSPREPQLLVYPVDAYLSLYENEGNAIIREQVAALQALLDSRQDAVDQPLPALPLVNAAQDLHTQLRYLDLKAGAGVRYLARYSQEAAPFTNDSIFYTFQGLSDDGKHYIAFYYPISASILPDSLADSAAANDYETFLQGFDQYRETVADDLGRLKPSDFTPNLGTLDALMESLELHPAR